jgi:hypothetical protein
LREDSRTLVVGYIHRQPVCDGLVKQNRRRAELAHDVHELSHELGFVGTVS